MIKRKRMVNYHDKIVELAKSKTLPEISRILDLSANSLTGYMLKNNIEPIINRKSIADYHEQIIEMAANGAHLRKIATSLGLDSASVYYHVCKHGIELVNGRYTVQNNQALVDEIITMQQQGFTYAEIQSKTGVKQDTVGNILTINKIEKLTSSQSYRNRHPINENAFQDFTTEESVYWYGWLVTDGCIGDKNNLALGLQGIDVEMVQRFADYIKPGTIVKVRTNFHKQLQRNVDAATFSITNKMLADRLRGQGLEPRKSCIESLPKFDWLNGEYAAVFWRACVEGDGYISKDVKEPKISLVGGEELLNGFIKYCEVHCGTKPNKKLYKRKYGDPNFRILEFNCSDAVKVMNKLWSSGSIFLERKQAIVQSVLDYQNNR